jgi:hypothetical protein
MQAENECIVKDGELEACPGTCPIRHLTVGSLELVSLKSTSPSVKGTGVIVKVRASA